VDFLNFPDLTTDVLGQAFGFLFGRLSHILDRRSGATVDDHVGVPAALDGAWRPVPPDEGVIEAELPRLRELAGALGSYERYPERLTIDDAGLRADLSRLRALLERVYGQHITFQGEDRAPTGTRVVQRMGTVAGQVIGIDGGTVSGANVNQHIDDVQKDGTVIGVRGNTARP
jgi:hypothetical protein